MGHRLPGRPDYDFILSDWGMLRANNERRTETATLVHTGRRTGIGLHCRSSRMDIEQAIE